MTQRTIELMIRSWVLSELRKSNPDLADYYRQHEEIQDGILHYTLLSPDRAARRVSWLFTISFVFLAWMIGTLAMVDVALGINPLTRFRLRPSNAQIMRRAGELPQRQIPIIPPDGEV